MKNYAATRFAVRTTNMAILLLLAVALSLTCISPAAGQKEKKKKPDKTPPADTAKLVSSLPDEQQIDYTLSEMLGAWQLGDAEKMHKDYADDVSIVSGSWEPPVVGWNNYLAIYQQQRPHMQQVRMDRTNTYIKVSGTVGWACYQWDFGALVDGQQIQSQGQTTVVLEKRNNRWVIVHNHTSQPPQAAQPAPAPAKAPTGDQTPAKPTPR
jgi:ketosteroid isomerase-like protein